MRGSLYHQRGLVARLFLWSSACSRISRTAGMAISSLRGSPDEPSLRQHHQQRKEPFNPPSNLRGLFVGSGSDGMNELESAQAVLELVESPSSGPVRVVYVGTATYDLEGPRQRQTQRLAQQGCLIESLDIATTPLTLSGEKLIENADVIVVSGGNTLYAMDRWKMFGVDEMFRHAMERGAVLSGGSAGAICWFDGGHSKSMDPDMSKRVMLDGSPDRSDESRIAPSITQGDTTDTPPSWDYIRVQGLGLLPGLLCPHHDITHTNGVLRAIDFDNMLLRHSGETGIAIDHWAALQVKGDSFTVLSLPNKEGSVLPDGTLSLDRKGKPGVWIKTVEDGKVITQLCPTSGKLSDILSYASDIQLDPREEDCRRINPAD